MDGDVRLNRPVIRKTFSMLLVFIALCFAVQVSAAAGNHHLPHYLAENRSRYAAYQDRNPDMDFGVVVALVNANADLEPYSHIQTVASPAAVNVLTNKNFALPAGYEPADLVTSDGGRMIRAEAAAHFDMMQAAAREDGHGLFIWSGYRSYSTQVSSYNMALAGGTSGGGTGGVEWADRRSARPGHSEHQTGLTIDVSHRRDLAGGQNADGFALTPAYRWLTEHAHKYGFILRYPQGLIHIHGYIYEPWHWRYVGESIATAMFVEGIATYEEYYGRYLAPAVRMKLRFSGHADSVFINKHMPM